LQGTKDHILTYKKSDQLQVIGYSDSDFDGFPDDQKSTSDFCFMMEGEAISWKRVKQTLIATLKGSMLLVMKHLSNCVA